MLEFQTANVLEGKKLNIFKKKSKKSQIFLFDTQRKTDDYLMKLLHRKNGKYDDIPHFLITKTGIIYNIFSTKYYSNTFDDPKIDSKLIKIAIENLGWLRKNTITQIYNNWIDDTLRSEPYIKSWRGYFFWDKYTEAQLNSIVELSQQLCLDENIPYQTVPSQGHIQNLTQFKGIVCKSNFQSIYTDINPSFDFRIFYKDGKKTTG